MRVPRNLRSSSAALRLLQLPRFVLETHQVPLYTLFRQLRGHHHHLGPEMVPSEVRSRGGSGPLDNLLGGGDTGTQQSILCLVLRCGLEAGLPISLAQ